MQADKNEYTNENVQRLKKVFETIFIKMKQSTLCKQKEWLLDFSVISL